MKKRILNIIIVLLILIFIGSGAFVGVNLYMYHRQQETFDILAEELPEEEPAPVVEWVEVPAIEVPLYPPTPEDFAVESMDDQAPDEDAEFTEAFDEDLAEIGDEIQKQPGMSYQDETDDDEFEVIERVETTNPVIVAGQSGTAAQSETSARTESAAQTEAVVKAGTGAQVETKARTETTAQAETQTQTTADTGLTGRVVKSGQGRGSGQNSSTSGSSSSGKTETMAQTTVAEESTEAARVLAAGRNETTAQTTAARTTEAETTTAAQTTTAAGTAQDEEESEEEEADEATRALATAFAPLSCQDWTTWWDSGYPERQTVYKALALENPDVVGWVRIEGTRINYPVVQTPYNPEEYLHKDVNGSYSSYGTPFIDAVCKLTKPRSSILIYGHHMRNGSMFAALSNYTSISYYQQHPFIQFDTLTEPATYQIALVFKVDAEGTYISWQDLLFPSDEYTFELAHWYALANRTYDTGVNISYGDELIALVTCEYSQTEGRLMIVGKRVW